MDDAAYPLARWACLVARARGVPVHVFPHHRPPPRVPAGSWLVTDGWCQGCGRPAPLGRLVALAAGTGGRVLVDDSLAFGVLGARRPGTGPFGDGTGTVRRLGLGHDGVVWLASLAKAHGTPVTVITGDRGTIAEVARRGGHRTHSSPPSQADLTAGLDSLARAPELDLRRRRLYRLTLRLRDGFRDAGLEPQGPPFPIVASRLDTAAEAHGILAALARDGFRALIQVPRCRPGYLLAVVVRADHRAAEVEGLVHSLRRAAVGRRAA
ncbi:hypothetical protein E7744_01060 [Citricoccus sp. SGAir0253]|uniref:hypothetical protein n=1 Tax=Citricoccus sp. SGAir0253 TaxID=2567881 RepID=UPI00110767BA|nr:hypothetical protein [Citricoccus sp. SGAir0253]QCU76971.1 hypothetical protein E7744_01060 [Citricoccus sp. SGAir0253]